MRIATIAILGVIALDLAACATQQTWPRPNPRPHGLARPLPA